MIVYLDAKFVPQASSDLRAAIDARHAVTDVLPLAPEKATIEPARNLKDPDKIAASIEERYQRALADYDESKSRLAIKREAAAAAAQQEWLDLRRQAEVARICAIAYALDEGPAQRIECGRQTASGDGPNFVYGVQTDEVKALRQLFDALNECIALQPKQAMPNAASDYVGPGGSGCAPRIVCHAAPTIVGMLRKRALLLGVLPPKWWPWDLPSNAAERIQDIQWMWDGGYTKPSLDRLAKAFGIPGRVADIADDDAVWPAIAAGRYDDIIDYCDDELLRLRCIHRRLRGLKPLKIDLTFLTKDWSQITEEEVVAAGYPRPKQEGAAA